MTSCDTYRGPPIVELFGRPHGTAELALFLAGDTSTFLFGQILGNDGGWS